MHIELERTRDMGAMSRDMYNRQPSPQMERLEDKNNKYKGWETEQSGLFIDFQILDILQNIISSENFICETCLLVINIIIVRPADWILFYINNVNS